MKLPIMQTPPQDLLSTQTVVREPRACVQPTVVCGLGHLGRGADMTLRSILSKFLLWATSRLCQYSGLCRAGWYHD